MAYYLRHPRKNQRLWKSEIAISQEKTAVCQIWAGLSFEIFFSAVFSRSNRSFPPCPSELYMAPRCSDPWSVQEILSNQYAKVGHDGQGFPPVTPGFGYLKTEFVQPGLIAFWKTGLGRTGGVLPKKKFKLYLDFFLVLWKSWGEKKTANLIIKL